MQFLQRQAWLALWVIVVIGASRSTMAQTPDAGHVKTSLIADMSAIRAGRSFTVGVLLEIEPHWHIYWTNPGDSGLATTVKWKLPEGFTAAPDPFPIPRQMRQGKEIVYGYETQVLLTAQVTAPPDIAIGTAVPLEAEVTWLACKEECVQGKANPSLAMKVSGHANPANVDAFTRWSTTVSSRDESGPGLGNIERSFDGKTHLATLTVHWKLPVSSVQVFPGAAEGVTLGAFSIKSPDPLTSQITVKAGVAEEHQHDAGRLPILISYRDSTGHVLGMTANLPLK